mgnify:CR=1 FL=1
MYRLSRLSPEINRPEIIKESSDVEELIILKEDGECGEDNPYIFIIEKFNGSGWIYFSVYEYQEKK